MLTISRAALVAASLSLFAAPAIGLMPAMAQETPAAAPAFAVTFTVPTITAVNSSMSEQQLKDLFSDKFLDHAGQLAGLNAESITIPELTMTTTVTESGQTFTSSAKYTDFVLTNIKDGKAERLTIGSSESVSTDGTTAYDQTITDNWDLKRTLELLGIVSGDAAATMSPLYTTGSIAGGTYTSPMFKCDIGPIGFNTIEARPTKVSFASLLEAIEQFAASGSDEPPLPALKTFVSYMTDVLRAFRGGSGSIGAVDCSGEAEPGQSVTFKLAGASAGDFEPGIYPELKLSGLSVDAGAQGNGSLGEFVIKHIDLNPTLTALDAAVDQLSEDWFEDNGRLLIPSIAGLSFSGFAIDAPNPDKPGEQIKATIANFDLSLADYLNGIPTKVSTSASGIDVPLPQDTTDPQMQMLLATGITNINFGFDASAAWDKASQTIAVDKLGIAAVDLGGLTISADIGNAQEELFALDENVAMAASLGMTVKKLTIRATDDGIGEKVWPLAAAQEGVSDIEAYRTQMAGLAEGLAIQLLGSTDASRQLGAALGDFVTGRKGAVTITITAKAPGGVPLALFMAAQNDPSILAGQVDVVGTAE